MGRSRRFFVVSGLVAALACAPLAFAASPDDGGKAPSSEAIAQEAKAFANRIKSGEIAALSDAELLTVFKQLNPEIIASYLELGAKSYDEYELWMRREERIHGRWPSKPFLNYVKYRESPRQVYIKWLPGGAKAGQEVMFDEAKRKDALYGHFGGLLNLMSIWTPLDGALARDNSNHVVTELGVQFIFKIVAAERALYLLEGHRPFPDQVEVADAGGERCVAMTWIAPSRKHYAKRTKVYLDLKKPLVRQIESWDENGEQMERILLEKIVPANFTDADFDVNNKAYDF